MPPRELPLRGFLHAIRTNALTMWPEAAYEQDIVVRRFLGHMNVLVSAPDAVHRVLVENAANYRRSRASIRILRPITGAGLLLSEGDAWRHQRRTIAPALAPRVLPMLARHIVAVADEQLAVLAAQAAQGPVELLPAMQSLTLEIAGRSMFSLEMQGFGTPLRRLLAEYAAHFAQPRLLDMLLPTSVPTPHDARRGLFRRRWMRLIESIMQERLRTPQPATPRDLFDLLRAARDPETGAAFTPPQLRDQLATLLLAGHETTAVTLFWTLTLLAQDRIEQQRVADEVCNVTIAAEAAMTALPHLVRTRAVVNEALRLYPPAFTLVREAIGPDRLQTTDVPKHAIVMIAPWVLHRHHRLWRDPAMFDPDRFMPDAPPIPRFGYLPFGAGPRICVGAQFALTETALVLALLLKRFDVHLDESRPVLPAAVVTTQPDHPPMFRLQAR